MKIGVELEAGFSLSSNLNEIVRDRGAEFKTDSSVRSSFNSGEIATRPYFFSELNTLENDITEFYKYIKEINDSMGFHLHFSFDNISDFNTLFTRRFNIFFAKRLRKAFKDNSSLMKRFKNKYCSNRYDKRYFKNMQLTSRYKWINWCSFERHGTVEFRIFNMPFTAKEAMIYILFTINSILEFQKSFKYKINIEVVAPTMENKIINI